MDITRRDMLGLLAASPFAASGCCLHGYPDSKVSLTAHDFNAVRPILAPNPRKGHNLERVIDVHAHFFNASDIPVRGFLVDCIGHTESPTVQKLLKYLGWIADALASLAPSADDEVRWLRQQIAKTGGLPDDAAKAAIQNAMRERRCATAERVEEAIRGKRFEVEYRELKAAGSGRKRGRPVSADDILAVVDAAESPSTEPSAAAVPVDAKRRAEFEADGVLRFLYYFLSYRADNIDAYIRSFCDSDKAFGVDTVLATLVDFDYWLDCPPRSSHEDQIQLLELLACLHGKFLRPVVAYNPWTDIKQKDAGLKRVLDAHKRGFVAAKIYPPVGFMPAGNIGNFPNDKPHPDPDELNRTLEKFFATCAKRGIPVLSHAEHTNGRDDAHDAFSSPEAWRKVLENISVDELPVIDLGHFGGGGADDTTYWTKEFADLLRDYPRVRLYGDLGYWVDFMDKNIDKYGKAKNRLEYALQTRLGGQTGADRVMFGSDWLMLSRVDNWSDYPKRVYDAVSEITDGNQEALAKIFGGNAKQCFNL